MSADRSTSIIHESCRTKSNHVEMSDVEFRCQKIQHEDQAETIQWMLVEVSACRIGGMKQHALLQRHIAVSAFDERRSVKS